MDIASILSYVKWDYLFIVIGVFVIFGGVASLIRGLYLSTAKYIAVGLLCIILVCFMPTLISACCSIDLTKIIGSQTITIAGGTAPITTVDQTVITWLESTGYFSSAEDPEVVANVLSLAHAVVGLAVYLVGLVLILYILGPLLGLIIYLVTFGIFLSSETKKKHKHRFWASLEGVICGAVIGVLFVSPFSYVLTLGSKVADQVAQAEDNGTVDKTTLANYQAYIDLLSSYDDSAFYSAMRLGSTDSSAALDSKIMGSVTALTVDGTATSLTEQVSSILDVVPYIASAMGSVGGKIDYETLLAKDNVLSILDIVSNWKIIIGLFPALMDMAENSVNLSKYGVNVDFSALDLDGTISDLKKIYSALYDAGVVTDYVLPMLDGTNPSFTLKYEQKSYYKTALETLAGNSFIKGNTPSLLSALAKAMYKNSSVPFISTLEESYKSVDLSSDISSIVEFAFDLVHLLGLQTVDANTLGSLSTTLMDAVKNNSGNADFFTALKGLFCGATTFTLPANAAYSEAETITGFSGLLSMDLFSSQIVDLPYLFTYFVSKNADMSKYFSSASLKELGDKLQDSGNAGIKSEFAVILDSFDEISKILTPTEDMKGTDGNIDFFADATVSVVKSLLGKLKNSTIVKKMLPTVLTYAINNAGVSFDLFGLTVADLNLNPVNSSGESILIDQFINLLDYVSDGMKIFKKLDGLTEASDYLKVLSDNSAELTTIMKGIVSNKVLNPDKSIDGKTTVHNSNFNALIEYMLTSDTLSSIGLTLPADMSAIDWLGTGSSDGEIDKLMNCVGVLSKYASTLMSGSLSITDLSGTMVKEIFESLGQSALLSSSLSSILNSKVAGSLADLGVTIDFNAITDWSAEGANFGKVVDCLKGIVGAGTIDSIDWMSLDSDKINELLTDLSQTQMLSVQKDENGYYVDKIGEFCYTFISKMGLSDAMTGNSLKKENFSSVTDKYTGEYTKNFWVGTLSASGLDTSGQIYLLCQIFSAVKNIGVSAFQSGTFTSAQLGTLLTALCNSSLFKEVMPNLVDYELSQIGDLQLTSSVSIKVSAINASAIGDLSGADLTKEISCLTAAWDTLKDDSFLSSIGADPTAISNDNMTKLENLLNNLASMKMMTEVKSGQSYSFFIQTMGALLDVSTLDEMITGLSGTAASNAVLPVLSAIDDWTFDETVRSSATSEILRITSLMRQFTSLGISLSDLSDPSSVTAANLKTLLYCLNDSEVLHKALPVFFERIFNSISLDSFLSYNGVKYASVDTHVHTSYTTTDMAFWKNEIDQICSLFTALTSSGSLTSLSNITIGGSSTVTLYSLVSPLDQMELFKDAKSLIVLNLLNKNSDGKNISDYIRSDAGVFTSTKAVYCVQAERLKTLLFPDGHTQAWLQKQCSILNDFISSLTGIMDANFSSGSDASLQSAAFDLIMKTMEVSYDSASSTASYTHCFLASELLGNLLSSKLSLTGWYYTDASNPTDFQYFDIVEARGIKGIMLLSTLNASNSTFEADLTRIMTLMGRTEGNTDEPYTGGTDTDKAYNYMLLQTEASSAYTKYYNGSAKLNNSVIAMNLFDAYADKFIVLTTSGGSTYTLKQVIAANNALYVSQPAKQIDYHSESFQATAVKVNAAVQTLKALP